MAGARAAREAAETEEADSTARSAVARISVSRVVKAAWIVEVIEELDASLGSRERNLET
jgi:hypothetical protein